MGSADLPRFFYNRTTRIWFPYATAVFLLYCVAFFKDGTAAYFWQSLAFDLTLTHNLFIEKHLPVIQALPMQGTNSHFWTIAVEEQSYLIAPLLIIFIPFARHWISWIVITILATHYGIGFGSVSAGILAATLQLHFGDWHRRPLAIVALIIIGSLACLCWMADIIEYRYLVPIMSIVVVLLLAHPGRRTKLGIWAGGISFPMYLNHWTGLFASNILMKRIPQLSHGVADSIGYIMALCIAAAAYFLIDKNILENRAQIYSPKIGFIAMTSAYALTALGIALGLFMIGTLNEPPETYFHAAAQRIE